MILLKELIQELLIENIDSYRINAISTLKDMSFEIKEQIESIINQPIESIFIHGSILHPKKFHENSDIDIAITLSSNTLDKGVSTKLSEKLMGQIFVDELGFLDIMVFNNAIPKKPYVKIL